MIYAEVVTYFVNCCTNTGFNTAAVVPSPISSLVMSRDVVSSSYHSGYTAIVRIGTGCTANRTSNFVFIEEHQIEIRRIV